MHLYFVASIDGTTITIQKNVNRSNIGVIAKVENSININVKSIVTFSNIFLIGTLNIYDDSSLTMNENSNFSEQSEINIIIQQSKSYSSK